MNELISEIKNCTVCRDFLPCNPRPVLSVHPECKILVIGQAPGQKVHDSGIPWNDQSGKELRRWLGVSEIEFYDPLKFGIMPMGFCYPGKGKSGDLPPRPECAPLWHLKIRNKLEKVKLTLLIGHYAQKYYLGPLSKPSLTETVHHFQEYLPEYFPLVHPSPRNKIWQKKNSWFEKDIVPILQSKVAQALF